MIFHNLPTLVSMLARNSTGFSCTYWAVRMSLDLQGENVQGHHPAIRCLGLIISAYSFPVNAFFANQLQHRLEKVDVKAQVSINRAQQSQFLGTFQAVISDGVAHY